jgi:hypothetical protein
MVAFKLVALPAVLFDSRSVLGPAGLTIDIGKASPYFLFKIDSIRFASDE